MIRDLLDLLYRFFNGVRFWVIVSPFEQVLRVRLGKHMRLLHAGVHLRIPVMDTTYTQSVRRRVCSMGRQTVTSKDGVTITFCSSVGYAIKDIMKLYLTLHHAEDTISNLAQAAIADYIGTHELKNCNPQAVQNSISKSLTHEFSAFGLDSPVIYLTEYATVKTFRVIGDWGNSSHGTSLSVEGEGSRRGGGPDYV